MASLTAMRPTLQRTRFGKPTGLGGRPRPVALVAATKRGSESKPNYVLDAPTRLWEIGSSYWFPFSGYKAPDYLDGSLPGDRGFDPFSLGASWGSPPMPEGVEPTDAQRLNWLLEGELYNGRVAMLAVVGVLAIDLQGDSEWWTAPYRFNWPVPYAAGVIAAHVVFALLEKKRIENYIEKGEAGHFGVAVFDPLGITDDYKRQAEVRNCRLAMLTFLGYSAQAYVTGMGPIESALAHLKDPFGANIFTYGEKGTNVAIGFIAFSVAMHLAEVARSNAEKKALA